MLAISLYRYHPLKSLPEPLKGTALIDLQHAPSHSLGSLPLLIEVQISNEMTPVRPLNVLQEEGKARGLSHP